MGEWDVSDNFQAVLRFDIECKSRIIKRLLLTDNCCALFDYIACEVSCIFKSIAKRNAHRSSRNINSQNLLGPLREPKCM